MNDLNSILIEGKLVRDVNLKTTASGTAVCTFSMVSTRYYKQDDGLQKEISYFDVQAWGKLAETCHQNGTKNRGVRVVGRIKQESWQDKDGNQKDKIVIVAEHIEWRPVLKSNVKEEEAELVTSEI